MSLVALPAILGGEPGFKEWLPIVRPTIDDVPGLARNLEAILESGMLTNGRTVRELEERVCDRVRVAHAVAVSSCTAGLMLTYQALRVGPGHRVLLPSFTFAASAHAVAWTGADADFCEVTDERCSLDVADVERQLDVGGPVGAISATHVYGHPAEVEALDALAADRGVPVVYDAAHALGSSRAGRPIGGFGTAEVFSLSPTKVVVAGEGGLVTTNDAGLAETLRLGRDYGNPGDYDCRFAGLNARMSELHAAVALASLTDVDAHVDRRHELVARFGSAVAQTPGIRIVHAADGDRSTYKDLTLIIDAEELGVTAVELQRALAADGVDSRRYYAPPIHRQVAYSESRETHRPLSVTDALAHAVLSPPLWSHLPDEAVDAIVSAIHRIHVHSRSVRAALRAEPV